MRRIETSITIDASPELVWAALTDFASFPDWNPFIMSAAGKLEPGRRLDLKIKPDGGRPWSISPVLLNVEHARELRWRGKILVSGLFDGEHVFQLTESADGTRLEHFEVFTGILVPLAWGSLEQPTRRGFIAMNEALKKRVTELAAAGVAKSA